MTTENTIEPGSAKFGPGDMVEAGAYLICVGTAEDDVRGGKVLTESVKKAMGQKNWENIEAHLAKVKFSLKPELFLSDELQAVVLTVLPMDDVDLETNLERFAQVEGYLDGKLGNRWQLKLNLDYGFDTGSDEDPTTSNSKRSTRKRFSAQKGHSSLVVEPLRFTLRSGVVHVANADNEELSLKFPQELKREFFLACADSASGFIELQIYLETAGSDAVITGAKPVIGNDGGFFE